MDSAHPLYRFTLAMAILQRQSLILQPDLAALPTGEYNSVTIRAYLALLQQRAIDLDVGRSWQMPKADFIRGTLTVSGNKRKFRIILSWGSGDWQVFTQGKLANKRGAHAHALKWVVSGYAALPRELRVDFDLFSRTVAVLVLAGLENQRLKQLTECACGNVWQRIQQLAAQGDMLCERVANRPL